jgi:transposase-like protein
VAPPERGRREVFVPRPSKFTDEQKYEIAMELIAGKSSLSEVCRKWSISSTYAYKLKDRALEAMRQGVARPAGKPDAKTQALEKKVEQLEQLAGDQALAIRMLKKTMR